MATSPLNPYAAPSAPLRDHEPEAGRFVATGISVSAAQGWRWIHAGFVLFKQQPGTSVLMGVVFLAVHLAITALQAALGAIHPALSLIASLASIGITPILIGGWMLGCHEVDEGGEFRVGHLFVAIESHLKPLLALAGWILLATLGIALIVIAIIAAIGFAAFTAIASGSIRGAGAGIAIILVVLLILVIAMLVYSLVWFAPALIVLHDHRALDAMKASAQACLKNIVPFLVYGLCTVGLGIVASLPLLLGWLVLGPILIASIYAGYRDIFYK
ncbi:MAG: BPSS1780 family membrane protein [Burkholderiales bacterium]